MFILIFIVTYKEKKCTFKKLCSNSIITIYGIGIFKEIFYHRLCHILYASNLHSIYMYGYSVYCSSIELYTSDSISKTFYLAIKFSSHSFEHLLPIRKSFQDKINLIKNKTIGVIFHLEVISNYPVMQDDTVTHYCVGK